MGYKWMNLSEQCDWDRTVRLVKTRLEKLGHDIPIVPNEDYEEPEPRVPRPKRKVICLETKKVYDTIMGAARAAGGNSSNGIRRACAGQAHHYKSLHYAFYDDYVNGTIPEYVGKTCQK